jgi:hypothetical protein
MCGEGGALARRATSQSRAGLRRLGRCGDAAVSADFACLSRPLRDTPPRAPGVKLGQWAAEPHNAYPGDLRGAPRLPHLAPAPCNPLPFAAALKRGARSVAPNHRRSPARLPLPPHHPSWDLRPPLPALAAARLLGRVAAALLHAPLKGVQDRDPAEARTQHHPVAWPARRTVPRALWPWGGRRKGRACGSAMPCASWLRGRAARTSARRPAQPVSCVRPGGSSGCLRPERRSRGSRLCIQRTHRPRKSEAQPR